MAIIKKVNGSSPCVVVFIVVTVTFLINKKANGSSPDAVIFCDCSDFFD